MKDIRTKDRRKKARAITPDRRKGPRRLVCVCGGKVEVILGKNNNDKFVCLRCGRKQ
jgi:hypothetical protein